MKQGLVIVDVQNDYFIDGKMELVGMGEAAKNCQKLLTHFREKQASVFHVQHLSTREGATFFIPDTWGCEIHESVKPEESEPLIIKHFPSSFRDTELHGMLQDTGVNELVICGAMSHMCIDTTVRAAFDLGYNCTVISDGCATRDLEFDGHLVKAADVHAAFMAALSVPFAKVLSTENYLN
ncbi:cysteine hydrolase family protein [Desulfobacterales bacterium HSG2]|nr:cysteine hydrolase family protein [Desulfobacterales bacterium HSG2]